MTSVEIKKLNAYPEFRTVAGINGVIAYVNSFPLPPAAHVFPPGLNARQRTRFQEKFGNGDWVVHVNTLMYNPLTIGGVAPGAFGVGRVRLIVIPNNAVIRNHVLALIYNNIHQGLGLGLNQFYHQVCQHYLGITRKQSSEFLKRQGDYQISRPVHKSLNYPILARCANELWQVDAVVLNKYGGDPLYNNLGLHTRILTVVDVFSKMVWAKAMTDERAATCAAALNAIFGMTNTFPHKIQTDNGAAFTSAAFRNLLAGNNIIQRVSTSYSPGHNAHVERMNAELRKKIRAGIVRNNNIEWSRFLDDYCTNINNQKTTSRGFAPRELWSPGYNPPAGHPNHHIQLSDHSSLNSIREKTRANQISRASNLLARERANQFHIGDHVRIKIAVLDSNMRKRIKASNESKYSSVTYTPQIYEVLNVILNHNPALPLGVGNNSVIRDQYTLEDAAGNVLMRNGNPTRFFAADLMHVPANSTAAHVPNMVNATLLNRFT